MRMGASLLYFLWVTRKSTLPSLSSLVALYLPLPNNSRQKIGNADQGYTEPATATTETTFLDGKAIVYSVQSMRGVIMITVKSW
jgi:hypothetical protein